MNVDIYISERSGSREIRIPWLPEELRLNAGEVDFASYDIMNRGEVAVPVGTRLASVSWESAFPGAARTDRAMQRGTWKDPSTYHKTLEDWRKNHTPLRLMVTGFPINVDVFLSKYEATAEGGFGDLSYEITFLEDRDIQIGVQKVKAPPKRPETQSKTTTYTIKKGDTLWGISQRFLGGGAKWTTIYNANKDIIESTAKKRWKAAGINRDSQHGHWIFPGTVIKIPK